MECSKCSTPLKRGKNVSIYRLRRGDLVCYSCKTPSNINPESKNYKKHNFMRVNDPVRYTCSQMIDSARKRAKALQVGFDLTVQSLVEIAPERCPILGLRLSYGGGIKGDNSPSLDRIDNSLGYLQTNVRIISNLANTMKSHADKGQLLLFCRFVINEHFDEVLGE